MTIHTQGNGVPTFLYHYYYYKEFSSQNVAWLKSCKFCCQKQRTQSSARISNTESAEEDKIDKDGNFELANEMWLNAVQVNQDCWPVVYLRVLCLMFRVFVQGNLDFIAQFRISSLCLLLLDGSSYRKLFSHPQFPLSSWQVYGQYHLFPLFLQCDSAWWLPLTGLSWITCDPPHFQALFSKLINS